MKPLLVVSFALLFYIPYYSLYILRFIFYFLLCLSYPLCLRMLLSILSVASGGGCEVGVRVYSLGGGDLQFARMRFLF